MFGHIHKPKLLSAAGASPIFYVGSPLALNFGETGSEHGCWLLDTDVGAFQIALDSPRLLTIDAEFARGVRRLSDRRRRRSRGEAADPGDGGGGPPARPPGRARGALRGRRPPGWSIEVITERAELVRGPAIEEDIDDRDALERWLVSMGRPTRIPGSSTGTAPTRRR